MPAPGADAPPQVYFFADPPGGALAALLCEGGVLATLASGGLGVAVALDAFDEARVRAVGLLNQAGVPAVAWLLLPPEEGRALNLQNYPRAVATYAAFREWARAHGLRFEAVGLDIEPPRTSWMSLAPDQPARTTWRLIRSAAARLWLARDNALYPSARAAYEGLVAAIQQDGYEVHAYQLPLIADDRRAGTTVVQRALDIVDLPADVDVLVCPSVVPLDWLGFDLGGALVESYGPATDALAISAGDDEGPLVPWKALRRDLLLAARHADTIYVATLEGCVRSGALARIAALDWRQPARPALLRRAAVGALRTLLLAALVAGRSWRGALAWSGWLVALALWLRRRR